MTSSRRQTLASAKSRTTKRDNRSRRTHFKPTLEWLEDRTTPSAYPFYATANGGTTLVSINQNTGVATTIGSLNKSTHQGK
jgi:hypothetical protein